MSHWNYRVIRKNLGKDFLFEIHEVYYDHDGSIKGWSVRAVNPSGDSLAELEKALSYMQQALDRPVLEEVEDEIDKSRLVEISPDKVEKD